MIRLLVIKETLKHPITRFWVSLLALYCVTLVVLLVSAVIWKKQQALNVATVAADLVRNNLVNNDYREPIYRLQLVTDEYFTSVKYIDRNESVKFDLVGRSSSAWEPTLFLRSLSIPLTSGSNARLEIEFSILKYCVFSLAFFFGLVLLSIPPTMSLWKRVQIHLREALEKQQKDLLLAIASQVSHDIRSPIMALNMCISKMVGDDHVKEIARSALERVNNIANQLLEKHRAAKINEPLAIIDSPNRSKGWKIKETLSAIVTEKIGEFAALESIKIISDHKVGASELAVGDGFEISRIVSNLVNNSVDALKEKGGTIKISTRLFSSVVEIVVSDNGPGIPPEILKKLCNERVSTKPNGNGIGITSASEKVKALGGKFQINSAPGEGTLVSIVLPLS